MTSTTSTAPDTGTRYAERKAQTSQVFTIATAALLDHIQAHHLTFPNTIYADLPAGNPRLSIWIEGQDHPDWLATVHIDSETNHTCSTLLGQPTRIRTVWQVRLPDTGTRVEITCSRDVPGPAVTDKLMSAVPA